MYALSIIANGICAKMYINKNGAHRVHHVASPITCSLFTIKRLGAGRTTENHNWLTNRHLTRPRC